MADGVYDLRSAQSATAASAAAVPLQWPTEPGVTDTMRVDLGWMLDPWTTVPAQATDLLRIATGAYLADALTARGTTFTRELALTVAVNDPARWTSTLTDDMCDLLYWLTGDQWTLTVVADDSGLAAAGLPGATDPAPLSLLSGGLDSFLGALHLLHSDPTVQFVGYKDEARVIRSAQKVVQRWLAGAHSLAPSYARVAIRQGPRRKERSSRSRSLLFTCLGVAAATMRGATTLYIPENGYTSLNVPLHPNRAGALSTRSTHPLTFHRVQRVLTVLDVTVTLINPFADFTKGEVMRQVADLNPPNGWLETSWRTISCSKLDGGRMAGGNPNFNCGLCVPCLVRRGTYLAAGQPDQTKYLVKEMTGTDRDELIRRRRGDLDAVRYATAQPVADSLIDAQSWPDDYDLDAATDLVQRGLDELADVPLP